MTQLATQGAWIWTTKISSAYRVIKVLNVQMLLAIKVVSLAGLDFTKQLNIKIKLLGLFLILACHAHTINTGRFLVALSLPAVINAQSLQPQTMLKVRQK